MRKAMYSLLAVAFLLSIVVAPTHGQAQGQKTLDIYFIDTEGGQATLFVSPSGESLLFDTGTADPKKLQAERISAAIKEAGVQQLDYVIVSHYHGDHTGQVSQFPASTLLIGKGDWDVVSDPKTPVGTSGPFASWVKGESKVEPLTGDRDVFGDGTVVMLNTPGHTPGHHSLLVKLAGMGNVLDDQSIWDRCDASTAEADALLKELIPYYRQNPDASMVSAFANSGLPTSNVAANVKLTISGGMNEPQHMVTNMVWALSSHHEQRAQVLADPSLWASVFDEAVRWQSPIGMYPRQTTRETVLEGVRIPAGAGIGVVVASANHDAAHFGASAADFDIHRPKRPHLAFGSGVHLCAGHWAAKTSIGQIAVPMAYKRFPGLRVDERRNESWDGWVFRGLTGLPVTWN